MDVLLENNKQVIRKFHQLYKDIRDGEQIQGNQLSDLLRNTAEILHFLGKTNTSEDEIMKGREQCLEALKIEVRFEDPDEIPEQLDLFLQTYKELISGKFRAVKTFA